MSTKSREVIWGSRIMGAQISAQGAREVAHKSNQEADRPEAEAWSLRMEAMEGPRSLTDDRTVPQRRTMLARGGVQSLQDPGEIAGIRRVPRRQSRAAIVCVDHPRNARRP